MMVNHYFIQLNGSRDLYSTLELDIITIIIDYHSHSQTPSSSHESIATIIFF